MESNIEENEVHDNVEREKSHFVRVFLFTHTTA